MQTHHHSTTVTKPQLLSPITILEEVPDPRVKATVDHELVDILTIALCTILCGGDSFYDMEEFGPSLLPVMGINSMVSPTYRLQSRAWRFDTRWSDSPGPCVWSRRTDC